MFRSAKPDVVIPDQTLTDFVFKDAARRADEAALIATVPGQGYRFIPTFSNAGWAGERDLGRTPRA